MTSERMIQLSDRKIFSVFFTAGFPRLNDTRHILSELQKGGVGMVEIGVPFSDPTADGPTIQRSSYSAIQNGMSVAKLFEQLNGVRDEITIPIVLMGYLNPAEQFGFERFIETAAKSGVDALILPDLPFDEYRTRLKPLYQKYGISPVFLVTSRTPEERIRSFDAEDPAFLYVVSSEATTGGRAEVTQQREEFFARLAAMKLRAPLVVGFGVADRDGFDAVTKHTNGAIVGSAFVRAVETTDAGSSQGTSDREDLSRRVGAFVAQFT